MSCVIAKYVPETNMPTRLVMYTIYMTNIWWAYIEDVYTYMCPKYSNHVERSTVHIFAISLNKYGCHTIHIMYHCTAAVVYNETPK